MMKRGLCALLAALLCLLAAASGLAEEAAGDAAASGPKPKVVVLATGGTIAGVGDPGKVAGYKPGTLTAEMLQYQKQFLPEAIRTDCLLPPVESPRMRQMPPPGSRPRFLYAGRIYGQRSARVLLEAFARLSGSPELVFIGPDGERIRKEIERYAPACRERIELLPWTPDLDSELERATALMDIDAQGPDDVYLSSKLFTYLRCPRPIVSITGPGSPARRLLSGMDSVLVCPHEPEAVQKALERCSEAFDYTDRAVILSAADADALARRLLEDLAL